MDSLAANEHGEYNDSLRVQNLPLPILSKEEDVLIRVNFSDVNPVDLQKLKGSNKTPRHHPIVNAPFVPGFGGSGTVVEVGGKVPQLNDWKGKQVCFLADPNRQGSYATHILVDYRCVALVPSGVSLRDAASIPIAGLTALECLAKVGIHHNMNQEDENCSNPKSLLVVGGAGGVGSWTILLARNWCPSLIIIATASTVVQQEWCRNIGANRSFSHEEISGQLAGGPSGSVDAIVCLSEPTPALFGACAEVLRPYGNICLAVSGKSIESLDLSFVFFKCGTVSTETVFSSIRHNFQRIIPSQELDIILNLLARNHITAPISPDLESNFVSGEFQHALQPHGVLHSISLPNGRRGKFVMSLPS